MRAYSDDELATMNILNSLTGTPWISTAVELADIEDETDFNQLLQAFRLFRRQQRARQVEEQVLTAPTET